MYGQVIDKLAEYVGLSLVVLHCSCRRLLAFTLSYAFVSRYIVRNGEDFERVVMAKRAGDPKFSFLFPGGSDFPYYKWRLHCARAGISDQDAAAVKSAFDSITAAERQTFAQICAQLQDTQESISAAREWTIAHSAKVELTPIPCAAVLDCAR